MSTRSIIGVTQKDLTIKAIYCHFDGYLSGVGQTLADHYQDPAKIEALINLGDLSSLGEEIGEKHEFGVKIEEPWCTAYGRDRGEQGTEAHEVNSVGELVGLASEYGAEYVYLHTTAFGWEYVETAKDFKKIEPSTLVNA